MSGNIASLIATSAAQYGVPAPFLNFQLNQESSLNPNAFNAASNAAGIAQLIPGTATMLGVSNPYDPAQAIPAAAKYDAQLYQQTGSLGGALERYGTVGTSSTPTLIQNANAMLASIGAGPLPGLATGQNNPTSGLGSIGAGSSGAGQSSGFGAWFGELATRGALILIGLILIFGSIALLGARYARPGVVVAPAATSNADDKQEGAKEAAKIEESA